MEFNYAAGGFDFWELECNGIHMYDDTIDKVIQFGTDYSLSSGSIVIKTPERCNGELAIDNYNGVSGILGLQWMPYALYANTHVGFGDVVFALGILIVFSFLGFCGYVFNKISTKRRW